MRIIFITTDRGTVTGAQPFFPAIAAERLKEAFKGFATDDSVVIEIFTKHNYEQRMEIKEKYMENYGKDLIEEIKDELGGNYEEVGIALFTEPEEYIVSNIRDAISGRGCDEQSLIGLLVGRTNEQMEEIRRAYREKYDRCLVHDLRNELKGEFKDLMTAVILAERDEGEEVGPIKAKVDAHRLHSGGFVLDADSVFENILVNRSYPQLRAIFKAFKEVAEKDIEVAIKEEFSGDMRRALIAIVQQVKSEAKYFATALHKSFKGARNNDDAIIRIIVLRSEIDLQDIKRKYAKKYGKELSESIESNTRGNYKKILLGLVD